MLGRYPPNLHQFQLKANGFGGWGSKTRTFRLSPVRLTRQSSLPYGVRDFPSSRPSHLIHEKTFCETTKLRNISAMLSTSDFLCLALERWSSTVGRFSIEKKKHAAFATRAPSASCMARMNCACHIEASTTIRLLLTCKF